MAPVLNLSALSSPQSCRKFTPVDTPRMILLIVFFVERFSGPRLWLVSRPMLTCWGMELMRMLLSADWLMGDTECQSHIFVISSVQSLGHAIYPILEMRRLRLSNVKCEMTA